MSGTSGEALLLLAFNRPDSLQRVIDATRPHRPPRVYLAVDGPREGRDDQAAVEACRDLAGAIDWGAEVHTLFRDRNLGCGLGPASAMSWFFDAEERGIILEDDIVPSTSFFPFMAQMLSAYADQGRVTSVGGSSFVPRDRITREGGSRFSRYPFIWGWGTWRRAWANYRFSLDGWRDELPVKDLFAKTGRSVRATLFFASRFDSLAQPAGDVWDYQFTYSSLRTGGLSVISNVNLTENIGFGVGATHTVRAPRYSLAASSRPVATSPQGALTPDDRADNWALKHQLGATVPRYTYRRLRSVLAR